MIDVNAVREGTRWTFGGPEVTVAAVANGFVVFYAADCPAQAAPLDEFAAGARDPATADYDDVLRELEKCARTPSDRQVPGVQECLLRDAVIHLLKRLGPPVPLNVALPAPMPAKLEPVALPAEPDPEPEVYAVSALADECVVEADPKPGRLTRNRNTNRWV